ncbi:hypothetical protein AVEN_256686-1 [Araneus ventricosus]|uniref:Uncharacterized protein n=1 Tax=Araneus ventricosus TaxID=182803 RepID=A0A4Y2EGF9_ARAVE|nr:hypothetical protein AVEN_256686-1 [Araneus ventricosus]
MESHLPHEQTFGEIKNVLRGDRFLMLWGQEPGRSHEDFRSRNCSSPKTDCEICVLRTDPDLILREFTWNSGNSTEFFQQTADSVSSHPLFSQNKKCTVPDQQRNTFFTPFAAFSVDKNNSENQETDRSTEADLLRMLQGREPVSTRRRHLRALHNHQQDAQRTIRTQSRLGILLAINSHTLTHLDESWFRNAHAASKMELTPFKHKHV